MNTFFFVFLLINFTRAAYFTANGSFTSPQGKLHVCSAYTVVGVFLCAEKVVSMGAAFCFSDWGSSWATAWRAGFCAAAVGSC